jgi:hypothetical protein
MFHAFPRVLASPNVVANAGPQESVARRAWRAASQRWPSIVGPWLYYFYPSMLGLWVTRKPLRYYLMHIMHNLLTNSPGLLVRGAFESRKEKRAEPPRKGAAWVRRDAAAARCWSHKD